MHSKSIIAVAGLAGLANGAAIHRRQGLPVLGGGGSPLNSVTGLLGGGGGGGFNPTSMVSGLTSGLGGLLKRDNQAKADAQDAQKGQNAQDAQHWDDSCTQGCSQYCQQFLFYQFDQCQQQCPRECQQVPQGYGNQGFSDDQFGGPDSLSDPTNVGPEANQPFGDNNNFFGGPGDRSGRGNGRIPQSYGNNNNFPGQGNVLSDPAAQAFCHIFDQFSGQPNWQGYQQFGNQWNQQRSRCPLWQNRGGNPFQNNNGRPFGGFPGGRGSGIASPFGQPGRGNQWDNQGNNGFGSPLQNGRGFGSPSGGLGPQVRPQGYGQN